MRPLVRALTRVLLSGTSLLVISHLDPAWAACTFAPTAGDDSFVCDSGTSLGGLTDLGGNNLLLLPSGGSGTLDGDVVFGAGEDRVDVHSGTITGNVQEGSGVDDFRMTGGQIQSLNQGDNLDTFFMSGGRIIDAFDDGDHAEMTGGRIGRVNMKLDDNYFNMSGGTIDRNLVAGFGNDTIILSEGTIGGNVSVSGGTDSVTVTGGTIGGNVLMSFGTDEFTWDGGGVIYGAIDLGGDDDTATLKDLTNSHIGAADQVTGGLGTDALTLDNVSMDGVARLQNWESIAATNDTELTFDGNLMLGDGGTGTGTLTVDSGSTLFGGGADGAVMAFTAGQLANVVNSGRIDLTNGGGGTGDTFTIGGNYTGDDGLVFLDTVLGADDSPSDRLVIDGGTASGSTILEVLNAGGTGAQTTQDGILVVEATGGGTTAPGAFSLSGRLAAGAYEYLLFRGGTSAGSEENWYLRSTMAETPPAPGPSSTAQAAVPEPEEPEAAPPPPPSDIPPAPIPTEGDPTTAPADPSPPVLAGDSEPDAPPEPPSAAEPDPAPAAGEIALVANPAADLPAPNPDRVEGGAVPLYRGEVPVYAIVPPVASYLAMSTLGTFHERRGEQVLVEDANSLSTAWGRVFGQDTDISWTGTLTPNFDGSLFGVQAGLDLLGWDWGDDQHDRIGVFVAHTRMQGDADSPTLGGGSATFGDVDVDGTSVGATWTHIGPRGWYLDGVIMGTWFGGDATSGAGQSIDVDGSALTLSLEGGYPVALSPNWHLEPQAQLIWQHLSLDDQADSLSSVSFDADDGVTGRLGFRLQGDFQQNGMTFQPYLKANLWHEFDSDDLISFGANPVLNERGGTRLEIGGGIVTRLTEAASLFASADYTTDLEGGKWRTIEGNLGLTIRW